jgi:hypothetical protein
MLKVASIGDSSSVRSLPWSPMGSKFTKTDLLQLTDYVEFESFCHNLLAMEGYAHIEPLGGGKDKGRDAVHVDRSTGKVTIFAYSVREDWEDKLNEDLGKIHKRGHTCDEVVFLTNGSPTAGEKDKKKKAVKEQYGWGLDFYDLERISTLVDSCHQELRTLHPQIFIISSRLAGIEPTGGELEVLFQKPLLGYNPSFSTILHPAGC